MTGFKRLKYPGKIIMLLMILACATALMAISEVTDDWSNSCLKECSAGAGGQDCNPDSIRFIGDQYARAVKGEAYWDRAGQRKFGSAAECAEFRFSQLRAICPAAAEVLRKSIR